jgi:hypothetical protein
MPTARMRSMGARGVRKSVDGRRRPAHTSVAGRAGPSGRARVDVQDYSARRPSTPVTVTGSRIRTRRSAVPHHLRGTTQPFADHGLAPGCGSSRRAFPPQRTRRRQPGLGRRRSHACGRTPRTGSRAGASRSVTSSPRRSSRPGGGAMATQTRAPADTVLICASQYTQACRLSASSTRSMNQRSFMAAARRTSSHTARPQQNGWSCSRGDNPVARDHHERPPQRPARTVSLAHTFGEDRKLGLRMPSRVHGHLLSLPPQQGSNFH